MMNYHVKRIIVVIAVAIICCTSLYSQGVNYIVLASEQTSSSSVRLKLIVYGKSKKTIDVDAQCAALQVALFDGCPNTSFSKAFIEDGKMTSFDNHPHYFEKLYSTRYSDFIMSCEATSDFKKGDKNKGTEYSVEIKMLSLRKDLEKNGIKRKIGL